MIFFAKTLLLLIVLLPLPVNIVLADNEVVISDAWIREAPPNAPSLAGYMVMKNHSQKQQTFVAVSAPDFGMAMIHRTEHKDGMAHMVHLDKVNIPPKAKLIFKPNGHHLMLMKPKKSFKKGDKVHIKLSFSDGSKQTVVFEVRARMVSGDKKKRNNMMEHGKH